MPTLVNSLTRVSQLNSRFRLCESFDQISYQGVKFSTSDLCVKLRFWHLASIMTRPGGQIFNAKIICRSLRAQRRWLSIHEHQAQALLSEYKVPVPSGLLARSTTEVKEQISRFGGQGVVKAQILAGGRGKGSFVNGYSGGVHMVSS